ncbi:hypothetical protein DPMN_059714 [Dreissena polymorpha]|uniref:G-protein coupled receptors family 1 profile domain-containing protein n=1 Tax=Dreissena polymorpha TaxID=45954 RepID=A0A9D4C3Z5_DREPO|nr:hypothetical protein DPMN_059714 [Dreissena polymorpha]
MCRIWHYSTFVVIIVSNNLLIGMSVDRYLAVRYPLRTITGGTPCEIHKLYDRQTYNQLYICSLKYK